MSGQMEENIQVNGITTICREQAYIFGMTEENMRGNTLTTKSTGLEVMSGQMVEYMRVIGTRVSSMDQASIKLREMSKYINMDFGKRVSVLNGLTAYKKFNK